MYRLLVVDDEMGFRSVVRQALERWGYAVEEAADGREGVDRFASAGFDLVIVDLQMPNQAGVETIGLIRELSRDVPIIAVSGYPMALEDAMVMGASLSLSKPFGIEQLIAAVRAMLEGEA